MKDGSEWNVGVLYNMRKNCKVCGSRRSSASNPKRICAKCWRVKE